MIPMSCAITTVRDTTKAAVENITAESTTVENDDRMQGEELPIGSSSLSFGTFSTRVLHHTKLVLLTVVRHP